MMVTTFFGKIVQSVGQEVVVGPNYSAGNLLSVGIDTQLHDIDALIHGWWEIHDQVRRKAVVPAQ